MKALASLALLSVLSLPALARAQDTSTSKNSTGDKEAVTFNEIERGLYFSVQGGPFFVVNPPADESTPRPFSAGQAAQVEVGLDIGEKLSVGLFVLGSTNSAGSRCRTNSVAALTLSTSTPVPDVPVE